jgi:hypothetical protein
MYRMAAAIAPYSRPNSSENSNAGLDATLISCGAQIESAVHWAPRARKVGLELRKQ